MIGGSYQRHKWLSTSAGGSQFGLGVKVARDPQRQRRQHQHDDEREHQVDERHIGQLRLDDDRTNPPDAEDDAANAEQELVQGVQPHGKYARRRNQQNQ